MGADEGEAGGAAEKGGREEKEEARRGKGAEEEAGTKFNTLDNVMLFDSFTF